MPGASTYTDYETWAKEGGMKPVGRPNFYGRLGDLPGVSIEEGAGRKKIIAGLKAEFPGTPRAVR
jgi:hypothetical protein